MDLVLLVTSMKDRLSRKRDNKKPRWMKGRSVAKPEQIVKIRRSVNSKPLKSKVRFFSKPLILKARLKIEDSVLEKLRLEDSAFSRNRRKLKVRFFSKAANIEGSVLLENVEVEDSVFSKPLR